jgi:hypothetical protein
MQPLSKYVLRFINLMLPGFIYLTGTFILLQSYTNNFVGDLFIKYRDFIFYVSILIVVFSYACGFIMHLAEERILHWIYPKFSKESSLFTEKDPEKEFIQTWSEVYSVLIMIRHLFYSSALLGISLLIWIKKHGQLELQTPFLVTFITICIIILLAYHKERGFLVKMRKNLMNNKIKKSIPS